MSMIRNAANPNLPQLETIDRHPVAHTVPPPPPPPVEGEDYRATQTLAQFQRGSGGTPNADVSDLDILFEEEFEGDNEEVATEEPNVASSSQQNVEEASAPRTLSYTERKAELLEIRRKLDGVKSQIRKSNLDKDTKDALMDQALEIYRQIAERNYSANPDQIRELVSALKAQVSSAGASSTPATTATDAASTPASPEDKAE